MSTSQEDNIGETKEATETEGNVGTTEKQGAQPENNSWLQNVFSSTGQKKDKPKEPEKDYIEKFKGQTTFIFDEQQEKRGKRLGLQKQQASLKVILKSLYDEYYKKMMDGVLEFTNGNELNEDVKNMFKRALQALAEKKRIDQAAPPYYYPEEGSNEVSKSVISQMVVYDDKGNDKRLPILIYDPCIFELENVVKPSIHKIHDIDFHLLLQSVLDGYKDNGKVVPGYELIGLLTRSDIAVPIFYDTSMYQEKEGEAVPENILLKDILNYGVWKEKNTETSPNNKKIFMIEPKMMKYLLSGKTDGSYEPKDLFLSINYIPEKQGWIGTTGAETKQMEHTEIRKLPLIYRGGEREIKFNLYKYKDKDKDVEAQDTLFKQTEWYSEYEKTLSTKKGGQSKNTTAKKNKSKRNKSKKNK